MKTILFHFLLSANLLRFPYPDVYRDELFVDDFHGVAVKDPYHWLEDMDSDETYDFVEDQSNLTQRFLNSVPDRGAIEAAYTSYSNYDVHSVPVKRGKRYFFTQNIGDHHEVLYLKEGLDAEPEVVFDPNSLPEYWTISLGEFTLSDDGEILAYHLSKYGSDWKTIHFKNVTSREDFPEILLHSKGPDVAWTSDNAGVFYSRFPVENGEPTSFNNKLYYHRLGTNQSEDILISEFPDNPKWTMVAEVSEDGRYLIVTVADNAQDNAVYMTKLDGIRIEHGFQRNLIPIFGSVTEASYDYVSNINSKFFFTTNKDTNNRRVISLDVDEIIADYKTGRPHKSKKFTDLIPEDPNKVLDWAYLIKGEILLLGYIEDVKSSLEMVTLSNLRKRTSLPLPPGNIMDLEASHENGTEFFFSFQSFLNPGTIYKCDVAMKEFDCQIYKQSKAAKMDPKKFEIKQVFYHSKDGTSIPMYIVHKKNLVLDGTAPTLLTGYGGFGESQLPDFDIMRLFLIDHFQGVFAVPNIRGGGEYGKHWAEEGSRFKKQNTFDDFIAAAEYLIQHKYTSPSKLAVSGSSNGGLLVAACVNQRPDLFGAAIIHVGVLDMLRFQNYTEGYAWCGDYGCSDNKEDFLNLIKYSPLHNIKMPAEGQYPAVLVATARHDDRVVPSHSYKYIAELQHRVGRNQRQTNPLLLRVSEEQGHSENTVEFDTDTMSFCMEALGWKFSNSTEAGSAGAVPNLSSILIMFSVSTLVLSV